MKKLGPKGRARFKLGVWAGLVAWMVLFLAFGVVMAQRLAAVDPGVYSGFGSGALAQIIHKIAPAWLIFTAVLLVIYIAKWAYRKLR